MRRGKERVDGSILCNMCGKQIDKSNGIMKEDFFTGYKEWGYFSNMDLEIHKFILCEKCYENLIKTFKIPVQREGKVEVI